MQVGTFRKFLQKDVHPSKREDSGLQQVFNEIFPIEDAKGNYLLEYISYKVLKEKYSEQECLERNLSYQAPIKATLKPTSLIWISAT